MPSKASVNMPIQQPQFTVFFQTFPDCGTGVRNRLVLHSGMLTYLSQRETATLPGNVDAARTSFAPLSVVM